VITPMTPPPDAQWTVANDRVTAARCSAWWQSTPRLDGQRVGFLGHYAATDAAAGRRVLGHACERLRLEGCTLAIGPLDGNTWHHYRFVTDCGTSPSFFLEPDNQDAWPAQFEAEGFTVFATYRSAVADLDQRAATNAVHGVPRHGVTIRHLNVDDVEGELGKLYRVSIESFAENLLYTSISESEFVHLYRRILPVVRPELVVLAEIDRDPVGFLFAIPDALEAARTGRDARTIIVKTLAVVPRWRGIGLGRQLFARVNAVATGLGFTRAIHALMHDGNVSQRISGDARTIRRYALYAKAL
jgi:GNAT superfamily N-acetyltransferase